MEKDVETRAAKKINYTDSFTFSAEAELGYIFQERFKGLRGLGYSFTLGYRAKGASTISGQNEDDDDDNIATGLTLEMNRYDIWHGAFINANLIW
ncbi:MAG TPA: hypothetical protein EYO75_03650 [Sulfurimonas sp.]|nr:hypothetical protein [Sulfurimonas sp.]HIM75203.1 hypothetical protein [Campylobacterales bacterium]